jgi:hypothetical protein
VLVVGLDWAEDHHDVVVMDGLGGVAARQRVPEGLAGLGWCMSCWPPRWRIRPRWWSGPRPTVACSSAPWWRLATRCMRSTRWPSAATATAIRPRGPSLMLGCQGLGRPGPPRPPQPPPHRRRQRAGRGGQGAGPAPPEPGLDPPTPGEPAAQPVGGVLPGALAVVGGDLGGRDALAVLQVAPTRPWAGGCRGPSWPRRCAEPVVSAAWTAAPPSCGPSCANRSWSLPRWSPRPTAPPSRPWSGDRGSDQPA